MRYFLLAVSFLTRIPVPALGRIDAPDFARSALFYPLVGFLIGVILCVPYALFSHASPLLLAAIITVLWAALTGGLHLDGLADSADAWLGGFGDMEKTHRILKDPLVGAAGVIAISSVMLLKVTTIAALLEQTAWDSVLFAPLIGRTLILLLFLTTPYVRKQGLASAVTDYLAPIPTAVLVGVCILLGLWVAPVSLMLTLLGFWLLRRLMLQRLQGCTGDTAGASVEIGEMLWLVGCGLFSV